MWVATHNGAVIACAVTRQAAIDASAGLLKRELRDAEAVARMAFVGLDPSEVVPPSPPHPSTPHPCATIDFEKAKRRVAERWLPIAEQRIGTTARIVDARCVEYDWGWVIHWEPAEPERGDPRFVNEYHYPFTADRVTGDTGLSRGTFGLERGIIELLQRRPDALRGPYPNGRRHWLTVLDEFAAACAFTPRTPHPVPHTDGQPTGQS